MGLGVRSSTSIGTCLVPIKRTGEDGIALCSATAAAASLFLLLTPTLGDVCKLDALGRFNCDGCGAFPSLFTGRPSSAEG